MRNLDFSTRCVSAVGEVVSAQVSERETPGIIPCKQEILRDCYKPVRARRQPRASIRIEKLITKQHKYNINWAWGVVISVGNEEWPVYFGSNAATLVYIATLLSQKGGKRLCRSFFKKPLNQVSENVAQYADVAWLNDLYLRLFPKAIDRFDEWYGKMQKDSCHGINQAKSCCNRVIRGALGLKGCCIKIDGEGDDRFYRINLPAKNIEVSKKLEDLIPGM